jgi:hypothetical protein
LSEARSTRTFTILGNYNRFLVAAIIFKTRGKKKRREKIEAFFLTQPLTASTNLGAKHKRSDGRKKAIAS